MEEIENIKNELNEIKTARDNIKTALQNEGETVTDDIRTYANTIPNVNKVKTVNGVEADTNKNVQLDASNIQLDKTEAEGQTIKGAIEELQNTTINVNGISPDEMGDIRLDGSSIMVYDADTEPKSIKETIEDIGNNALTDNSDIKFYIAEDSNQIYLQLYGNKVNGNFDINSATSKLESASSFLSNNDKSISFTKINSNNGEIDLKVESENTAFDPQESGLTSTKIAPAIRELKADINAIDVPEYTIVESSTTEEGYAKSYSLWKGTDTLGGEIGVKINIPKDLVINSGSVKTVETDGTPYAEALTGDKYLDIELNDPTTDHIYIPVKELVDAYTAGNGIEIDANNVIKSKNSNLVNGTTDGSLRSINSATESTDYTIGANSVASGLNTKASGENSHAEGDTTTSSGQGSHAEGKNTDANGRFSHAEGSYTLSLGINSHTEGSHTIASGTNQHVQGKYNIEDSDGSTAKYAHIVGNGTSDTARSNAHTVAWDGTGWFKGNVKVGGTGQDDANAKQLATEEYVDNNKFSMKTITNKITTDQAAGFTYSFGYKCDDLMVFLNGEKLVGKETETQTIDDYSYIPNYGTDEKCTSITFTNDFTVVTGDIIELVLINPVAIS